MALGPPWLAGTHASLDLFLGLRVRSVPEIETECDSSKGAEDLEKEDHRKTLRPFRPTPGIALPGQPQE